MYLNCLLVRLCILKLKPYYFVIGKYRCMKAFEFFSLVGSDIHGFIVRLNDMSLAQNRFSAVVSKPLFF